jgi:hypothetical protein
MTDKWFSKPEARKWKKGLGRRYEPVPKEMNVIFETKPYACRTVKPRNHPSKLDAR